MYIFNFKDVVSKLVIDNMSDKTTLFKKNNFIVFEYACMEGAVPYINKGSFTMPLSIVPDLIENLRVIDRPLPRKDPVGGSKEYKGITLHWKGQVWWTRMHEFRFGFHARSERRKVIKFLKKLV